MNNVLEVGNIFKSYGEKTVLNDISFNIKENEIFGLIGLNGVGKTTLIKSILDLADIDDGEILINGMNSVDCRSRNNLAYLPEKFLPSLFLTPMEFLNIFTNGKMYKEKIFELCEQIDFDTKFLNVQMSKFSKGMVQKIGLIASVLEEKKLIILDEPMSGLDPKARINLKKILLNYKKDGKSVFFSSHILSDLDEICDRIAILNNKEIKFIGTPKELKEKYKEPTLELNFLKSISE